MTLAQRPAAVDDLERRFEAAAKSRVEPTALDANSATTTAIATGEKSMVRVL